ncbi:alpha/beta hydrolase [[Mycobacterium] wendilense]|uniref:Alpha/beta hydrolase n=1 Tax=[Mycobacterium] wendilense TaxID=3064284 RepID=A0ABN9P840_9MYCO|nr:alpha/beta hydrolase [Mycolicibacterium sp. MU0050]CAJ1586754.1 alpha/beta hydrolase [Mycolicibacterium sp. MU0050]
MNPLSPGGNPLDRLDPALRPFAEFRTDLAAELLPVVRASIDERRALTAAQLDTAGVDITEQPVPGDGARTIGVRIYRGGPSPGPAVLYCHGGAFVLGNLDTDHLQCVEFARRGRCTVISVDYRLAPEHPFPAGYDDAAAVLCWAVDNAADLGIDPARIAVAGSSAGGALAAGLAQAAARDAKPPVVFQLLHQPVLDNRPSPSKEEFTATPGFDGPAAEQMWRHYASALPAAAVPGLTEDLDGLPRTFISCSELDPLRDEAIDYALRLLWSGVGTELHVFPGTCHGFDSMLPGWEVSQRLFELQGAALRAALG